MKRKILLHDADNNLITTITIDELIALDEPPVQENEENEILGIMSQLKDDSPPLRAPVVNIERNHPAAKALTLIVETINKNGFLTFVLNPEGSYQEGLDIEVESVEGLLLAKITQDEKYNIQVDIFNPEIKETLEYALKKALVFTRTSTTSQNPIPANFKVNQLQERKDWLDSTEQYKDFFHAFFREKPNRRKSN